MVIMTMHYILEKPYRLRGWYKLPFGLFSMNRRKAVFLPKEDYLFLLKCDGAHDLSPESLTEKEAGILKRSSAR